MLLSVLLMLLPPAAGEAQDLRELLGREMPAVQEVRFLPAALSTREVRAPFLLGFSYSAGSGGEWVAVELLVLPDRLIVEVGGQRMIAQHGPYFFPDSTVAFTVGGNPRPGRSSGRGGAAAYTAERPPQRTYADLGRGAVEVWMGSAEHRANILNARLERLGAGAAYYRVQETGRYEYPMTQNFAALQ